MPASDHYMHLVSDDPAPQEAVVATVTSVPKPVGIPRRLETATERANARDMVSRILPGWANKVLKTAAAGREFDAWVFQCALTHALSACATRHGQSMGRRALTRKARALAYRNQRVLDDVLRGKAENDLGAYHTAVVRDLEERLAQSESAGMRVLKEREDLRTDLATARATLDIADQEIRRLVDEIRSLAAERDRQSSSADFHAARASRAEILLAYARRCLSRQGRIRLDGYADRVDEEAGR